MSNQHEQSSETRYFFELTPDRILQAVESCGVECTGRVLQLNSMENRVYEVEVEIDDAEVKTPSDRFRVVKFYRPGRWSKQQILEEHEFLLDLRRQEIPVVAPLVIGADSTLHEMSDVAIWFALFPKQGGRNPDELSDEQAEVFGRLIARIHNVGGSKSAPHRLRLDPQVYGRDNLAYLLSQSSTETTALPAEIREGYRRVVEEICQVSDHLFEGVPFQRLHGDCHLGNLIWGSLGPALVDFDDMVQGPCVQDLWLLLPGRDQEGRRKLEALLVGYEQFRSFDWSTIRLIEPLRALRMIHFSGWIARRWHDPAFQRAFPHFGSLQYWREQVADLQDQLRVIHAGGFGVAASEGI